ncbi:MAG: beta-lactamase family protein, partial [Myxococcales bacterium]|nr:beta-lactamase family protein [Myxococcales bacterium]
LGYTILGVIVSRASGVPYRTYVTNQILRPLGMTATVFDEREVPSSRLALGYRRDGDTLVSEANTRDGAYAAMGGLYSSVRDLSRYAAFHLAAWPPRDDPETGPLRRSSVRELHQLARPSRFVVGMEGGAAWGETGGYGLGFFSYETCLFDHLVYHRGGLPGYGSALFMLPKRGVAIITLANATYANPGAGVAMKILQTAGDLKTPAPMAGPALVSARGEVDALLGRWDGSRATNAFDPSFFLGEPADKLKARLAALRSVHGACREAGAIEAENALRGTWRAQCDRGWVDIKVTLAPMLPSKIQFLEIVGSLPPEGPLLAAAGRAAALTEQWDDTVAAQLFAPSLDLDLMKQRLGEVSAARGACKLGDAQRGDGKTQAVFALSCARRPATLEVTFDAPTGKLTDARISALDGPDAKCAQ